MTATQLYKQRVRDLVAFGAILTAMGIVAIAADRIHAAPREGQVVRKQITEPKDGHSFAPVPPASQQAVIGDTDWPDPKAIYVIKYQPATF